VSFALTSSQPTEFAIQFRVPAWAEGAEIHVNGARQKGVAVPGRFAALKREWKTGDRIELELPLKKRLEPIDSNHAGTVALVQGPLVLMAAKPRESAPLPKVTREQLLAARRISQREWQVSSSDGPVTMTPFTWMGSRPYSVYLQVS